MSEQVERRLVELLGHPTESPYGNPIPGLDQLGDIPSQTFEQGVVGLVRRLNEAGQPVAGDPRFGHPVDGRLADRRVSQQDLLDDPASSAENKEMIQAYRDLIEQALPLPTT